MGLCDCISSQESQNTYTAAPTQTILVCLEKGVSPEGWTQDDGGWRYRNADGSIARNTALTIDGRVYTFDGSGYAAG